MVDILTLQSAITGLKTAGDLAKGLLHLHSLAEVQTKVIDLQSTILSAQTSALAAQSEQSAMVQRVRDLEEEVARVKAWKETQQRYQLISPWSGFYAYAIKETCKGTEPPHWICAHCYEDGNKSILQHSENRERRRILCIKCPRCGFETERGEPRPQYV